MINEVTHVSDGVTNTLRVTDDEADGGAATVMADFKGRNVIQPQASSTLVTPAPNVIEPEQPNLIAGLATIPGVVVRLAATVAAAFLSPFLTAGPTAPAQPPMLWAVLGWVRREFERTLCNETPKAVDDSSVSTSEDTAVSISALANDSDGDHDPLTVTDYTQPEHGTVTYDAVTKQFTYTPDENFSGTDTFQYAVSDEGGLPHWHGILGGLFNVGHQDTATVTVTVNAVNDAPVANPDAATVAEDSTTPVAVDVLANDSDVEGNPLSITDVADGTYGTATFSGSTVTYTLDNSNPAVQALGTGASMTDTVHYTLSDGSPDTTQGTITITITGVNDAPVITAVDPGTPDSVTGIIHGSVTATDVDGGTLTYTVDNPQTTYGTVSIDPETGEFVYTPNEPVASSVIPGTDVEDGTLAGWNVGPQTGTYDPTIDITGEGVSVSTGSLTYTSPARPTDSPAVPARTWEYTPDGHAVVMSPNMQQTFEQAGDALGLTAAQQQEIIATSTSGTRVPRDAAWISKTVHLEAGTTYTMAWNYISTDYQPFNDGSITTLTYAGTDGATPTVYVNGYEDNYAILGYTNSGTGDYSTGSYGSTGWQTSTYRVTETGDYTLGFAVFNLGDTSFDPVLLVDSEGGTTLRDGELYAPVPPNSPTAPRTVDDTFMVTVSDGNGGTVTTPVTVQVTVIGAPQTPAV